MLIVTVIQGHVCKFDQADWIDLAKYNLSVKKVDKYLYVRFGRGPLEDKSVSRYLMKAPDGILVDHKNGNTLDNTRENLRFATKSQNGANQITNRDLPKGVVINGDNYGAQIYVNKKRIWLGTFPTCSLAETAYKLAANKYFGEFASHNSR
jgi:hypothetical protein